MLGPSTVRRRHAIPHHPAEFDTLDFASAADLANSAPADHQCSLDRLFTKVARLASLPLIADRILRLPVEDRSCESAFVEVIRTDPAMASSILRRVNSSYFGITRKVNDLSRAATLLGVPELRNLALTVLVKRMFDRPATYGTYNREGLWRHSLAVAVSARKIARVTGAVPQHEACTTLEPSCLICTCAPASAN